MFPIDHPDTISITNDTEMEDDHDFNVLITSAGFVPYASIGTPALATVTISEKK